MDSLTDVIKTKDRNLLLAQEQALKAKEDAEFMVLEEKLYAKITKNKSLELVNLK